jgi:Xanthine dehydrogenase, molybdopterin-binding subunit B
MNHVSRVRGEAQGGVHTAQPHDSALKHTTGAAIYVDDIPEPPRTVHAALVLSPIAHGRLLGLEKTEAQALPGVIEIIVADDVPGENDVAPVLTGEPLLARGRGRICRPAGRPSSWPRRRTSRGPRRTSSASSSSL